MNYIASIVKIKQKPIGECRKKNPLNSLAEY